MTKKRIKKLLYALATERYIAGKNFAFGSGDIGKAYKEIRKIGFKGSYSKGYSYNDAYILFKDFFDKN